MDFTSSRAAFCFPARSFACSVGRASVENKSFFLFVVSPFRTYSLSIYPTFAFLFLVSTEFSLSRRCLCPISVWPVPWHAVRSCVTFCCIFRFIRVLFLTVELSLFVYRHPLPARTGQPDRTGEKTVTQKTGDFVGISTGNGS